MGRAYHAAAVRRRAAVALRQGACSCLRLRPGNGPASKLRTEPISRRASRGSGVSLAYSRAPARGSGPIGPRLPDCEQNDPMRLQSRERSGPQARESERFPRGFSGSPADPSAATGADQCAFRTASGTIPCAFRAASGAGRRPARASGPPGGPIHSDQSAPMRLPDSEQNGPMRLPDCEQNDPMRLQSRERSGPQARGSERFARGFSGSPADPSAATAADQCAFRTANRTIPCAFRAASEAGRRPARASGSPADSAVRPRIHPQRLRRTNAPLERRAERSHAPSEPRAKRAAGPRERAVRARIHRFARGSIRSDRSGSMRFPDCEQNDPMRLHPTSSRERP